jgi:hypothetical protein
VSFGEGAISVRTGDGAVDDGAVEQDIAGGRFRARLIGARAVVFTLAQPGSLIKTSVWPQRASKRPIRQPLSTSRQIPSAPHDADGAA